MNKLLTFKCNHAFTVFRSSTSLFRNNNAMASQASGIRRVFPKEAFLSFIMLTQSLFSCCLWKKVTLMSALLCQKFGLYHLTLYCRRHREMTHYARTLRRTPDCTLGSGAGSDDLQFPRSALQHLLVSFIIVVPRARQSGNIVVTHFTDWNRQCDQDERCLL